MRKYKNPYFLRANKKANGSKKYPRWHSVMALMWARIAYNTHPVGHITCDYGEVSRPL